MKCKYVEYIPERRSVHGKTPDPNRWITGPDIVTRDKYYAWLKHRAQAKYRKEDYDLTWEDWQTLWSNEDYLKRGRKINDLCLQKIDPDGGWTITNVEVNTRYEYLKRAAEYRARS